MNFITISTDEEKDLINFSFDQYRDFKRIPNLKSNEKINIDLRNYGYLGVDKFLPLNFDDSNYDYYRHVFTDLTQSMFMLSSSTLRPKFLSDPRIENYTINGMKPDYSYQVYRQNFLVLGENYGDHAKECHEFKSTLFRFDSEKANDLTNQIFTNYMPLCDQLFLYFLRLDESFPSKMHLNDPAKELYYFMRNNLMQSLRKRGGLSKYTQEYVEEFRNPFDLFWDQEMPDFSKTYENPLLDKQSWIDLLERTETFVDHNLCDQKDVFSNVIEGVLENKEATIFLPKLWDRDFSSQTLKGKNRPSSHGHRANYLFDVPILESLIQQKNLYNVPLEKVLSLIREVLNSGEDLTEYKEKLLMFLSIAEHQNKNEEELLKIQMEQAQLAFIQTELSNEIITKGVLKRKDLLSIAVEKIRKERENLNKTSPEGMKITKAGYYRISKKRMNVIGAEFGINKHYKVSTKLLDDHIDPIGFEYDFNSLLSLLPKGPGNSIQLKDFYPYNKNLNEHANELCQESGERMNSLLSSRGFGYLYYQYRAYKDYLMKFPSLVRKATKPEDFAFFQLRDLNSWLLCTSPPVEINSGTLICLTVVPKVLINKFPVEFPEAMIPYKKIETMDSYLFISKPFRWNMSIVHKYEEIIGYFIGTCATAMDYNVNLHMNPLFCSLFWRYNRMLNLTTDLIYLVMKGVVNLGNLGRIEYRKKFKDLKIKDVRIAQILSNLFNGYSDFQTNIYEKSKSLENTTWNLIDPVLKERHLNFQTIMIIIYLKQIFLKRDGFDEKFIATDFFLKEVEFQEKYENSPFHHSKVPFNSKISLKEFGERLFKDEDKDWTEISYHPASIYWSMRRMLEEASGRNPSILDQNSFEDKVLIDTGKQSKCLMRDSELPNLLKKKVKEKEMEMISKETGKKNLNISGRYDGLQSINLTEALYMIQDKVKGKLIEQGEDERKVKKHLTLLSEAVWFELLDNMDEGSILTVSVKEQKGYDKRIFFVQTSGNRNLNKYADESFNRFLRNCLEDMIMNPGEEKNQKIESRMRDKGLDRMRGVCITEDQTKYGDMYPLHAFRVLIQSFFDGQYYSKTQALFLNKMIDKLEKRVCLAPFWVKSLLEKETKWEKERPRTDINNKRFWDNFEKLRNVALKNPWPSFNFSEVDFEITKNIGLQKEVGFVLGVFNKMGSTLTAGHIWLEKHLLDRFGLSNVFDGLGHSDDVIKFCAIKMDKVHSIPKKALHWIFKCLRLGGKFISKPKSGRVRITDPTQNFISKPVPNHIVVKFLICISVLCPRLFGQRPSLTKWMVGNYGEVLQVYTANGHVIPPIMRFSNALGADLPGKSPAQDLYMATGRIYQVFLNGGTNQLLSDLLFYSNWLVFHRFGMSFASQLGYQMLIPELGGLYWFYPPFIGLHGLYGNDFRLLTAASSPDYYHVANQYRLMIDTDLIFKEHTTKQIQSTAEIGVSVSDPDDIKGSLFAKKDFPIRYARNLQTLYSFRTFSKEANTEIMEYLSEIDTWNLDTEKKLMIQDIRKHSKDYTFLISNLKSLLSDRIISRTGDARDMKISFLSRYLTRSFQESYLRIPPGVMITNRIGYYNRNFSDPFSEKFYTLYPNVDKQEVRTVSQIQMILMTCALDKSVDLSVNGRFFELNKELWTDEISYIKTFGYEISSTSITLFDKDLSLDWVSIKLERKIRPIRVDPSILLAAYIQKRIYKQDLEELPIVKARRFYFSRIDIKNHFFRIVDLLQKFWFSDLDIIRHSMVFRNVFSTLEEPKIYRGTKRTDPLKDRIEILGSTTISNEIFLLKQTPLMTPMIRNFLLDRDRLRLMNLMFLIHKVQNEPISSMKIMNGPNYLTPEDVARGEYSIEYNFKPSNRISFNFFLAQHIFNFIQSGSSDLQFYRSKKHQNRQVFKRLGIKDGNNYVLLESIKHESVFSEEQIEKTDQEKDFFHVYTNLTDGPKVYFYIFCIMYFLRENSFMPLNLDDFLHVGVGDFVFMHGTLLQSSSSTTYSITILENMSELIRDKIQKKELFFSVPTNDGFTIKELVQHPRRIYDFETDKTTVRYFSTGRIYSICIWEYPSEPTSCSIMKLSQIEEGVNALVNLCVDDGRPISYFSKEHKFKQDIFDKELDPIYKVISTFSAFTNQIFQTPALRISELNDRARMDVIHFLSVTGGIETWNVILSQFGNYNLDKTDPAIFQNVVNYLRRDFNFKNLSSVHKKSLAMLCTQMYKLNYLKIYPVAFWAAIHTLRKIDEDLEFFLAKCLMKGDFNINDDITMAKPHHLRNIALCGLQEHLGKPARYLQFFSRLYLPEFETYLQNTLGRENPNIGNGTIFSLMYVFLISIFPKSHSLRTILNSFKEIQTLTILP